ncbi:rod shape-determining protein MreD [Maricurvus nonylphenolicus]|uniref:rod shape-determining protein MreD n=1 Tax=Maricurvus nonylphenolicus TaxID=1008307 RepID=UPI0036F194A2
MSLDKAHNRWVIWLGFFVGCLLTVFPLSAQMQWLRPEWIALLVIYWTLVMPLQISITLLWVVGLFLDILEGSLLGSHALALMAVVYVCLLSYQRLRNYVLWHQTVIVFMVVGIHQLIDNWVHSLTGSSASSPLVFLMPAFTSALVWPVVWLVLERFRVQYRVT